MADANSDIKEMIDAIVRAVETRKLQRAYFTGTSLWNEQCNEDIKILAAAVDLLGLIGSVDEKAESKDRRAGFDVGRGHIREGDLALYKDRVCLVLTVHQDGEADIETFYQTARFNGVKWRELSPYSYPT